MEQTQFLELLLLGLAVEAALAVLTQVQNQAVVVVEVQAPTVADLLVVLLHNHQRVELDMDLLVELVEIQEPLAAAELVE